MLGVALAAALVAETFVASGTASAVPATPPVQEEPTRGPNGLETPDIASARTIARLEGERVEVIGERTESSSTWAMPDGTMTTGQASGPIWLRQGDGDGTSSADWVPVDLTLEAAEDGSIRPKAHPADLVLAGEGAPEGGALVSMAGPSGETVGLQWDQELPAPRLEGPRAVYADVQPGVDLVVEATRTGYEQREMPAPRARSSTDTADSGRTASSRSAVARIASSRSSPEGRGARRPRAALAGSFAGTGT